MTTNSSDVTAGTNAVASEYNNLRKDLLTGRRSIYAETDGATVTFDLDNGSPQEVTLEGNRTLALSNDNVGQIFVIKLIQDGTGSRIPTWWGGINWSGDSPPVLTTTADYWDWFGFIKTGAGAYDGFVLGKNYS